MPTNTSSQDITPAAADQSILLIQQPIDSSSLNSQDLQFISQAGAANQAEIDEASLATSHSDNAAVQLFGQWMITDHIALGTALNDITQQLGIGTNVTFNQQQTQDIQNLGSAYGTSFDQLYTQNQVADHQQTLALFQQEVADGQNPTLKSLAQQAIPILDQHLAGAQQVAGNTSDGSGADNGSGSSNYSGSTRQDTAAVGSKSDNAQNTGVSLATPSAQDISFVQFAAQSGLTEVQEGQLATADTANLPVSVFGRWMVTDHTAVNAVLQTEAQQEGITVPTAPSSDQQAEVVQLQSLPADAFASTYTSAQVTDHANTLMHFVQEATKGQDPVIKAFAQGSIPLLAEHFVAAIDLQLDQLGLGSIASPAVSQLTKLELEAFGSMTSFDGSTGSASGMAGFTDYSQVHALMSAFGTASS